MIATAAMTLHDDQCMIIIPLYYKGSEIIHGCIGDYRVQASGRRRSFVLVSLLSLSTKAQCKPIKSYRRSPRVINEGVLGFPAYRV